MPLIGDWRVKHTNPEVVQEVLNIYDEEILVLTGDRSIATGLGKRGSAKRCSHYFTSDHGEFFGIKVVLNTVIICMEY